MIKKSCSPKTPKELPERLDKEKVGELVKFDVNAKNFLVEILVTSQKSSDLLLRKPLLPEEELRHRLWSHFEEASLLQQLQAFNRVQVELLDPVQQQSILLLTFASR